MNLYEWAMKWGIPHGAIVEMRQEMGMDPTNGSAPAGLVSEAGVSKAVRLAEAASGGLLWRNNVGAMQDASGRVVRYGLANESKAMNKSVKSSDLIGIRSIMIQPQHVGSVVGQFVARECKAPGWTYSGTEHEQAQLKFIELVTARGGDAEFTNGS